MGKLIMLGVAVFFSIGIALEIAIDAIFSGEAEAKFNETTERIEESLREDEVRKTAPARRDNAPTMYGRQMTWEDCSAAEISGWQLRPDSTVTTRVSRVIDGDTLEIMLDGVPETVRLWGIDAPEMGQKGGERARQELADLTPPRSRVTIHLLPTDDKYGRLIANVEIHSDPAAVNFLMVAHGWAYHYNRFHAKDNPCFIEAERAAAASQQGLWSGRWSMEKPWDYRSRQRDDLKEETQA